MRSLRFSAPRHVRDAPLPGGADGEPGADPLHVREALARRLDRRPRVAEGPGPAVVRLLGRPLGRRLHVRREHDRQRRAHVARQRGQSAQPRSEGGGALPPGEPEPDGAHRDDRRSEDVHANVDAAEPDAADARAGELRHDGDDLFADRGHGLQEEHQRPNEQQMTFLMRALGLVRVAAISMFVLLPVAAWAQSSITGVVSDASGGVLPGVTVEAASPALIEGVRSAVTDAQGIYKVVDLRPGTYTVTFTLPGFRTLKREGLSLPAEFAATVNADLAVGALEETVTVSGEAPVVDVKSSRAQTQFEKSTIEALPGAGRLTVLSDIVPGATLTQELNRGVGGTSDRTQTRYSVHGGPESQPYVDGMNQQLPNSTQGVFVYNLQQVDLRVSRVFALGGTRRIRPSLDVYNLLNASNVINMNVTYGPNWKDAIQILSGRLLRIGAQFDF